MQYITLNIVWIIAILLVLSVVLIYNSLVRLRNRVKESWSDIEVQLKRRHDLIPNLVNTVKGYAQHEQSVFENVTKARAGAEVAGTKDEKASAENALTNTLKTLFAVAENYPDLKANANFLELQRELSDTENKIQAARRFYNGLVMKLNTSVESFPSNVIASIFKFQKEDFFGIPEEEKEVVDVDFSSSPKQTEENVEAKEGGEAEEAKEPKEEN